ncbi:MAG: hypothetical protein ACI4OR_00570 [Alphaproteobacteria bacterium]
MGLLDKLKELTSQRYEHMLFLEGDEFERAARAMLGNIPNATSSNAHNKEMEIFLYKLFGEMITRNEITALAGSLHNLFNEFSEKGYPLAEELVMGLPGNEGAFAKVVTAQSLLDNPFATKEQKKNAGERMKEGFYQFARDIKTMDSKATSKDVLLWNLEEMNLMDIPELDPKYLSSELGQHINKELAPFMNKLRGKVDDTLGGSASPLSKKSLEFLEEFANKGYPSAQEMMAIIADGKNDKKAVNRWAKEVEKNPFSTEEQKKNARDDIKDTQAFVNQYQSKARGGRE